MLAVPERVPTRWVRSVTNRWVEGAKKWLRSAWVDTVRASRGLVPIVRYWARKSERSLVADFLRTRKIKVQPLSRGSAGLVAPAVIPGGGGGGGVAKELLHRGKIRTGVEKVPGVAAPQSWGEMRAHPGRQGTSGQELAYRLDGEAVVPRS